MVLGGAWVGGCRLFSEGFLGPCPSADLSQLAIDSGLMPDCGLDDFVILQCGTLCVWPPVVAGRRQELIG